MMPKTTTDNVRAEIVGSIIQLDDIKIEYFKKIGQNSTIGIVGKLKSVNGIPISYHLNYSENHWLYWKVIKLEILF